MRWLMLILIWIAKIPNFTNLLPPSINHIKTKISKYIGIGYWSIRIVWPWSNKVKVAGANQTVKMSIYSAFSRTPTKVFVRLSSKLEEMCYMNLWKNVGSRYFEFLTQSIFLWGQTLLKSTSKKWTWKQWVELCNLGSMTCTPICDLGPSGRLRVLWPAC